jgi:hypothetical protein
MDRHVAQRRPWLFQPTRSRLRGGNEISNIVRSMGAIEEIANDPRVAINGRPIRWYSTLEGQRSPTRTGGNRTRFTATSRRRLAARQLVLGAALLGAAACVLLTALLGNA